MKRNSALTHSGWMRLSDAQTVTVEGRSRTQVLSELSRQARHAREWGRSPVVAELQLPSGNNVRLRWNAAFGDFHAD